MDDVFINTMFHTKVQLAPHELCKKDINDAILSRVKNQYEGVCSSYGYISPGSMEIQQRSIGREVKQHLNGFLMFNVVCSALLCKPVEGMIFPAVARKKCQFGMLLQGEHQGSSIIDVIVPKVIPGVKTEVNIADVGVGDTVNVEVLGVKNNINKVRCEKDKKNIRITVIGKVVRSASKALSVSGEDEDDAVPLDNGDVEDVEDNESDAVSEHDDIDDEEEDAGADNDADDDDLRFDDD